MESLTPVQRVSVITIGLALTVMTAIFVLPWAGKQVVTRLPPTKTPVPATATPLLTATPTEPAGPTPTPTLIMTPPPRVLLEPMSYEFQTQDNNGPASLGIVFSYWGYTDTQEIIAPVVRPGELDTSVEIEELAEYAQLRRLATHIAVNGDAQMLRQLLSNGFPIIVARWLTTTEGIETRHYQVLRGYDRAAETFILHDSSAGDIALPHTEMDDAWRVLNRSYLLVFPPEQGERVRAILGSDWTETTMWEGALAQAERELGADTQDALAWLNKGDALLALEQYEEAQEAFDEALAMGLPMRLLWYRFGPYECLLALERYADLLALTQVVLDEGATLERLYLYRAQAYVALGDTAQARVEYEQALDIHPGWKPAEDGLSGLSE